MPDYRGRRLLRDPGPAPTPVRDYPAAWDREDDRVFKCPCGVLYVKGGFQVAHSFEPCRAYLEGESNG